MARPDRIAMVVAIGLSLVTTACETIVILLVAVVTNRVLIGRSVHTFWGLAAEWVAIAALGSLATYVGGYLSSWISERFVLRTRDTVYGHLQQLSPDFFANRDLGDLVARVTTDTHAVEELVASGVISVASASISAIVFCGAALWISWQLALIGFAVAPVFVVMTRGLMGPLDQASQAERSSNGVVTGVVEANLANMPLVQAYNRPHDELRHVHDVGVSWLRARLAEARLSALYAPVNQFVETLCVLTVLGFGGWQVARGRMNVGELLGFAAFLGMLYPPIQHLGGVPSIVAEGKAGAGRLVELLDTAPAVVEPATAVPLPLTAVRGDVEFDRVSFGYPRRPPTLTEVSFTARAGTVTVVTGPSGAGKSTLARLLLRFYDPEHGRVLLDGVDIAELSLRSLRDQVTLLLQESMMLDGTVRENITYGRPDAADDQIQAAAQAADAHTFITALPQGYDTMVGQRGHALSGGQRQRIAIARAMLRDTPVLVLDEPTTGLDALTTHHIIQPLQRLMTGRTTILITHDLHLAPHADQIIVISDGRVIERGTHTQLITNSTHYAQLWHARHDESDVETALVESADAR